MALGLVPVLILFGILCCVDAELYVYKENFMTKVTQFHDILCKYGPGLPLTGLTGILAGARPRDGCSKMEPAPIDNNIFVVISRGNCSYEAKVRHAQDANYSAVIVYNVQSNELVPMYYENSTGIRIPAVFVSELAGLTLLAQADMPDIFVTIDEAFVINTDVLFGFTVFVFSVFVFMLGSMCVRYIRNRRRRRRRLLPPSILKSLPRQKYNKDVNYDTCVICQDNFKLGDMLRILPCSHAYHVKCIDVWLTEYKRVCPVCKRRILGPGEDRVSFDSDSDSEDQHQTADDRTPLLSQQTQRDQERSLIQSIRARLRWSRSQSPDAEAGSSSTSPDPPLQEETSTRVLLVNSVNNAPEDNLSTSSSTAGPDTTTRNRMVQFLQELFVKMKPDTAGVAQNRRIEEIERAESQRRGSVSTTSSEESEALIGLPADSRPHASNTHHPEC
uniref:E3 ubiquitin-protein ligase RNF13 n=1 Tax=Cacopsylla melanoneura TaxID=428564 RepID=A0A8D9FB36_9HEMI